MASSKVASKYARALLDFSIEQKSIDKVNNDMVGLANICKESKDLTNMLKSPIIDKNKKVDVLNTVFGKSMDKISLQFIELIVKNSRANIVPEIADSFVQLYKDHNNILDVYLTSAIPLEASVKKEILAKIKTSYKGEFEVHESVDSKLLGGFIVNIDGKQIDLSVASQLSNLKNILLN